MRSFMKLAYIAFTGFLRQTRLAGLAVSLAVVAASSAFAQSADQAAISQLLHGMFDRPGSQLTVAPIVVSGDNAIAGWTQGDMGGRALLRKKQQIWTLILCAGDEIKSRDALAKVGIPVQDAAILDRDLAAAESALPPQQVAMFSRFQGVMMMDGSDSHHDHHDHDAGH